MTNNAGGISFKEALQEALAEEDSAESDLAPTAVEVVSESEALIEDQPPVESDEEVGLFKDLFVEKEEGSDPDEGLLTIEIQGRRWTVAELEEGVMLKADYTRKTQELSELRKENEKALVLWRALQEKPQETVRSLMMRVGAGQPVVETPVVQEQVDIDALVAQKVAEALGTNPQVQAFEAERAWQTVNVILDEVQDKYNTPLSQATREQILVKAQQLGTEDLEYAFWTLLQDKQRRDAAVANAQANATVQNGIGSDAEDNVPQTKSYRSFRDAMKDTLSEEQFLDTEFLFN